MPTEKDPPAPASGVAVTAQGSQDASPAPTLSQWLQLMLAEIARKREELESAHAEAARRALEGEPQEIVDREAHALRQRRPSER